MTLQPLSAREHTLAFRIPAWCSATWSAELNGQPVQSNQKNGYVHLHHAWQPGDTLMIHLPMTVRAIKTHPFAVENQGRVALMRGPFLYCLEAVDHPTGDVQLMQIANGEKLTPTFNPDLFGGVVTLHGDARIAATEEQWDDALYRSRNETADDDAARTMKLTAIPYYAWANRAIGPMQVWLPIVAH